MILEETQEIKDQVHLKLNLLEKLDQEKVFYLSRKKKLEEELSGLVTCETIAREKIILTKKEALHQVNSQFKITLQKLLDQKEKESNKLKESVVINKKNMQKLEEEIETLGLQSKSAKLMSSKRVLFVAQFEEADLDNMSEKELKKMTLFNI